MDQGTKQGDSKQPVSADALGALVAFLDSGGLNRRRYTIVNRLKTLRDSAEFAKLPDDLCNRVREIVADAER